MRRSLLPLLLLLPAAGLAGCGGARSLAPAGAPAAAGDGDVRIAIAWPAPKAGRLIPDIATSVTIDVTSDAAGVYAGSNKITRPADSFTFKRVPIGGVTVKATAFAATSSTPLATGSVHVQVVPDKATDVPIELASTITAVTVSAVPDVASIKKGETVMLLATARNAQGAMVLSDGFGWNLAGDAGAVSSEQGKDSITLTGQADGTVTAFAKEADTGIEGSAVIKVSDQNQPPAVLGWTVTPDPVPPGGTAQITVDAADPDNDPITYAWSAGAGTLSGSGASVTWTAPATEGSYDVTVSVKDATHAPVSDTHTVVVGQSRRYTVTDLADLGLAMRNALGYDGAINSKGQIIGYDLNANGCPSLWDNGQITHLPTDFMLADINDQGVISGAHHIAASTGLWTHNEACFWANGQVTVLPGKWVGTVMINGTGHYAGQLMFTYTDTSSYNITRTGWHAALDGTDLGVLPASYLPDGPAVPTGAIISNATGINSAGHVIGYSEVAFTSNSGSTHAMFWNGANPVDLDAGRDLMSSSFAYSLNDANHAVGFHADTPSYMQRACLWTNTVGGRTDLPLLPNYGYSEATHINNLEQIVGHMGTWDVGYRYIPARAVLWENGTVTDLNDVSDVPAGAVLTEARKITDSGLILCLGKTSDGAQHAYVLTPSGSRLAAVFRKRARVPRSRR